MLTKRQMDFNIKLWDVCASWNHSDDSLCAIAIATLCRQWFAGHSSRPRWLSCQHTLSHDAHALALRPADKSHLVQTQTRAHLMVTHLSVGKLQKLYVRCRWWWWWWWRHEGSINKHQLGSGWEELGKQETGKHKQAGFEVVSEGSLVLTLTPCKKTHQHAALWFKWLFSSVAVRLECVHRV